jgi:hypothetical protein
MTEYWKNGIIEAIYPKEKQIFVRGSDKLEYQYHFSEYPDLLALDK